MEICYGYNAKEVRITENDIRRMIMSMNQHDKDTFTAEDLFRHMLKTIEEERSSAWW